MKKNSPRSDAVEAIATVQRKPQLLFVGEGPDDIGRTENPGGAAAGFLQAALVGSGDPVESKELAFTIADIRIWRTLLIPLPRKKTMSFSDAMDRDPERDRVRAALLLAATQELDGVFVLKDCEQEGGFDLQKRLRDARIDFEKNDSDTHRPCLVVATPSRVHETWLLADTNVVTSVFGSEGVYKFSQSPENRPHSDKLKAHIKAQSKRCHIQPNEARRRLAFLASPKTLTKRCPKCYPGFLKDVDDELRPMMLPS
jgi:hypothetical protein